ncbi:MAG: ABC transporter permease subunit [Gammaproteobacteria bacterium]|nr:ABC transporter permease subunit [Gammaproteobacteria bacterium]
MAEGTLSWDRVQVEREVETVSRPSLSYWQDAWIRLKANRRALISLYLVVALLAFTVLGPFLWTVDPAAQDLDQISVPPGADRTATVAEDYAPWRGVSATPIEGDDVAGAPATVTVADQPTTNAVRLSWDPVAGARGYRVYRNQYDPEPDGALGLPIAEILSPANVSFEDRLDLKAQTYFYSVVALDRAGRESAGYTTVTADVTRVITAREAVEKGLIENESDVRPGDTVKMAFHPLGTDYLGRDMLARLMHGARVSLFIGIVAPFFFVIIGILYGSAAGFMGGRADQALMRFADFVVALPFLLFMILLRILFNVESGDSGIGPMLVAMVLLSWPAAARLVRGQILQIREEGYIGASRLLGAKTNYLVLRHMIPNTMGVILVTLTFAVPSAIFTEAFLSFIGMGVAPPTPSWGSMCNEGLKTMLTTPHELIAPAAFISITVLAFNLLGDGLRDALDARMRATE